MAECSLVGNAVRDGDVQQGNRVVATALATAIFSGVTVQIGLQVIRHGSLLSVLACQARPEAAASGCRLAGQQAMSVMICT